jgi:sterol desaturase/sphingolipid hydroxylase (fatty acid hydroxylase superfamily)
MRSMNVLYAVLDLSLGLFLYSFVEYAHHRWGGHTAWLPSLRHSHQEHHRDPQEGGVTFGTKLRERLGLVVKALTVFAVVLFAALPWPHASIVLTGLLAGYGYSEWFHHQMHHHWPTTAVGRFLWRHHYVHHFIDGRVNYGFTSPFWDLALGTLRVMPTVQVPGRRVPPQPYPPGISIRTRKVKTS